MYLVTAEEMRAFDAVAINDFGIPGIVLMENAGRTTFEILATYLDDDLEGLKVSVVAGAGNNGGDGYVIARWLLNHGADVRTFLLAPRYKIRGDALTNLETLERMTSQIFPLRDEESMRDAFSVWRGSDVIVDAILGTGLNSEVRSPYREAIERINDAPGVKLAVDLPSGLDADTGRVLGVAVMADITATYGFRKIGTAIPPGEDFCGLIEVVDISIPRRAIEAAPPGASLYEEPETGTYFGLRADPNAHKGVFGHLLVVGGSPGKTGAPAMAARAAARMGTGLVTVAVPASLNPILEAKLTEEMTEPLPESVPGYLSEESADRILSLAEGKQCIVLGPGLSVNKGIPELAATLVRAYDSAIVIDADGLNALADNLDILKNAAGPVVLTPHPGEMARLMGISSREVQSDRISHARKVAADLGVWVVLKGAGTVTASPDGRVVINSTGNPWMASGGQGDALSGILGGLLAQGIPPEEALPFGVYLHGLAADRIVERRGPAPVPATEVIEEIPAMLGEIEE
jgi:NAD(P)H-hydrate epimerase